MPRDAARRSLIGVQPDNGIGCSIERPGRDTMSDFIAPQEWRFSKITRLTEEARLACGAR